MTCTLRMPFCVVIGEACALCHGTPCMQRASPTAHLVQLLEDAALQLLVLADCLHHEVCLLEVLQATGGAVSSRCVIMGTYNHWCQERL